jgi:HD-GYP domain-containing protein (c-di-GMP phosphodiesterase class II)
LGIVQQHAVVSRDILAGIVFGHPVATIVVQHHERLDGSGCPDGLKGAEVILEARIPAVADVVSAMTSARPHRPALELDAALEEVRRRRRRQVRHGCGRSLREGPRGRLRPGRLAA